MSVVDDFDKGLDDASSKNLVTEGSSISGDVSKRPDSLLNDLRYSAVEKAHEGRHGAVAHNSSGLHLLYFKIEDYIPGETRRMRC